MTWLKFWRGLAVANEIKRSKPRVDRPIGDTNKFIKKIATGIDNYISKDLYE